MCRMGSAASSALLSTTRCKKSPPSRLQRQARCPKIARGPCIASLQTSAQPVCGSWHQKLLISASMLGGWQQLWHSLVAKNADPRSKQKLRSFCRSERLFLSKIDHLFLCVFGERAQKRKHALTFSAAQILFSPPNHRQNAHREFEQVFRISHFSFHT